MRENLFSRLKMGKYRKIFQYLSIFHKNIRNFSKKTENSKRIF